MALGVGSGLWGAILPVQKVNFVGNPSGEYGTATWGTVSAGTVGTTAQFQQFGAWAGSYAPTSNTTCGALVQVGTALAAGDYTISAYVRGANGIPYRLAIAARGGASLGSTTFTGGGTWSRISFGYTEVGGAPARDIWIAKANSADTNPIYFDGVQVEAGSITTYIDGDQPGCFWFGAAHNSISQRDGQYRGGGSLIALADIGWNVDQYPGAGVPPVENATQSYAVVDGAQFQRTRTATRSLTLTAKPISGTSTQDFHVVRRTIWDVLKPDDVTPQQPIRFVYVGAQGTQQVDAYYDRGFELGNMDGPMAEPFAMSFISTDPYWYAPTQQGTALPARSAIGSTNFIAKRSPQGVWGSVGLNGGPNNFIFDLLVAPTGTMFVAGSFTTVDGTAGARYLSMYNTLSGAFGTLVGGTTDDYVRSLAYSPAGTLFYGGNFVTIAGTTGARRLGRWNGVQHGTLQGGTVDNTVIKVTYSSTGTLFVGGGFLTTAGTNSGPVTFWSGGFGTLAGGTISSVGGPQVYDILFAFDQSIYVSGLFSHAGGTLANNVTRHKGGTWGTLLGGVFAPASGTIALKLAQGPDAKVYIGGNFGSAGGAVTSAISVWNGAGMYAPNGGGVGTAGTAYINTMIADQVSGNLLLAGTGWNNLAGATPVPDNIAISNGASYIPLDIDLPGANVLINAMAYAGDRTLYVAGSFAGTAQAASVGSIINNGRAEAYPTLRLRNLSAAGTGRIYQVVNTTTNNGIYFNFSMLAGEVAELVLTPNNRSFTSNFRGNVFGAILPGSNLASWSLLPGVNTVSFFADSDSVEASLFWNPRGWAADSGTVY